MNGRKPVVIIAVVCISFLSGILVNASVFHWVMSSDSSGGMPKPDYDSGWIQIIEGEDLIHVEHNLSSKDIVVYFQCRFDRKDKYNTWSNYTYQDPSAFMWHTNYDWLNPNNIITISVKELPTRQPLGQRDYIRVFIWKIPEPPT